MQNSELANRLAEAVCIFYEKKCDAEKKLSFGVTVYDDKVHAEFERHTTHIIGWDLEFKKYGYQNLKTEEQLYGLSWLITEYMLDKLSTLGALYTLFSYKGGYPSVRVGFGPVFQVYEKPKELKEW